MDGGSGARASFDRATAGDFFDATAVDCGVRDVRGASSFTAATSSAGKGVGAGARPTAFFCQYPGGGHPQHRSRERARGREADGERSAWADHG